MVKEPLVVCLTNTVAANFTANVLLAIGAKPAMMEEPVEAAELTAQADALLVNVGTLTCFQRETMLSAVAVAETHKVPWVLDPVACQRLAYRRQFVQELLLHHPALIRGNLSEIGVIRSFLTCQTGPVPMLAGPVPLLATGETDRIYVGDRPQIEVTGGTPLLPRVTATGCAQGAIAAAFLGWGQTPKEACLSASRLMKAAGERAARRASKPGSFQMALLDALSELAGAYHE